MIMYQDKIENETKALIAKGKDRYNHSNVFIREKLQPLDFLLEEEGNDAAHIARDILSKRSNEDVLLMSKSIDSMLQIGENLLTTLSIKLLSTSSTRKAITFTQGRALYLLSDYFDLTTIAVKKAQWCEMFATLALMQAAEIVGSRHKSYGDDDISQAMKLYSERFILDMAEETIDSIARAECMFDKKLASSSMAKTGGEAKAKNMMPLKIEIIERYLKSYTHFNKKKAGRAIEQELMTENHPLLLLSYSEDKDLQFSKWIGSFLNGSYKIPFNK
jgi:hypothetical protein